MVSKASEDFPDPEMPVSTTNLSRGISTVTFFRLCSRAPRTMIRSSGILSSAPPARHPAGAVPPPPAHAAPPGPAAPAAGREERLAPPPPATLPPVPRRRPPLELQVGGGATHLPLQRLDRLLQFLRREHQQAGHVPRHLRPLGLRQLDQFLRRQHLCGGLIRFDLLGALLDVDQITDRLWGGLRGDAVRFLFA